MAYTEIKERNGRKYYYRVMSIRNDNRVFKKRLYLGTSLIKRDLQLREKKADEKFNLTIKNRKKEVINALKPGIIKILKRYKVKRAGLFGSYARGEQRKNSDVDILIEPPKGMGLEFVGMALDLEKELKRKVDLVTYRGINPHLKKYILEGEVRII